MGADELCQLPPPRKKQRIDDLDECKASSESAETMTTIKSKSCRKRKRNEVEYDDNEKALMEEKMKNSQLCTELELNALQRQQLETRCNETYDQLMSVNGVNDALQTQIKSLTKDRDEWKDKYLISNEKHMTLKKKLSVLLNE